MELSVNGVSKNYGTKAALTEFTYTFTPASQRFLARTVLEKPR